MRRRRFLTAAGSAALYASTYATRARAQNGSAVKHGRGATSSAADFAQGPQAVDPELLAGTLHPPHSRLPSSHIVSGLPPVYDQGAIASCEAHAFGYGLGGYTASRLPQNAGARYDILLAQNQPSRAWLFKRQITADRRGSCAGGTFCFGYLEQLAALGAPSEADVAYPEAAPQNCDWLTAIDARDVARYPNASRFLIGSYRAFAVDPANEAVQLKHIKRYLANDHILAFSGAVGTDFEAPILTGGVYAPQTKSSEGSHGQMVVGYDDAMGDTARGKGAFLVQNSWGLQWPAAHSDRPGYIWWSYNSWFAFTHGVSFAFPAHGGPPSGEALQADTPGAPQATIASMHATSQGLLLTHEFSGPVLMQQVSVITPRKGHWITRDGTTIVNGYSYFLGPGHFRAGDSYEVEIKALWQGKPIIYSGSVKAT